MGYPQFTEQNRDASIVAKKLGYIAVPGILGLLLFAGINWQKSLTVLGMGILVATASLMVGGVVGFLFWVQKSADPQRKPPQEKPQTKEGLQPDDTVTYITGSGIRRNTNIEEISDWLTKIIVGLGIYELKKVPELVSRLAKFLTPGFADVPGAGALSVILVVSFGCAGFLLGFILTVLFLTRAIEKVSIPDPQASLKEDVRIAELVGAVAQPTEGAESGNNVRTQVVALSSKYVTERASRPPGKERTSVMEAITRQMRSLAVAGSSMLEELSKSSSAGQRLAATAFLQVQPNPNYLDWLTERLPHEVPFIQYQMALALLAAVRGLSGVDKAALRQKILTLQKAVASGSDEFSVLEQVLQELWRIALKWRAGHPRVAARAGTFNLCGSANEPCVAEITATRPPKTATDGAASS
jgi:hypothetical protein